MAMKSAPSSGPPVREVELRRVRLPLVEPFRAAHGTTTERDILLVKVTTDEAEGWGECVAPGEPTYTEEYVDGAHDVLRRFVWELDRVKGNRMAKAAFEGAVLDAELRADGRSLRAHLGGTRTTVPAGVAVGVTGDIGRLLDAVRRRVGEGYRRVKLKIQPGWDEEPVAAVREAFGIGLLVQVDANGSYADEPPDTLKRLDQYALTLIEQPLADDDLAGHARLAQELATPICLDETITSSSIAAHALEIGACRVVCVKPGRVGGLGEAVRVHDVCVAAGADAWVGGMLETGLGRAANVALASLPGFTLPGDISASDRWFTEDLTEPFALEPGGVIRVPNAPGIGVVPRPDVLDARTVSVERLRPPR